MNDLASAPVAETPAAAPEQAAPVTEAPRGLDSIPASPRDAIDRAFDQIEREEAGPADKAPVEAQKSPERARDESGRFTAQATDKAAPGASVAKPEATAKPAIPADAPARFNADAKAAWAAAPEPLKAEVQRTITEMERGIEQYRREFEPLKPWADLAKQNNTSIPEALERYVAIDQMLNQNPMQALEHIFKAARINPRDYAAAIMGQPADKVQSEQFATVTALQQEIASLREQLGGVTQTIEQQREQEAIRFVEEFARDKPRFAELEETIGQLIVKGMAEDLPTAYQMADRLIPATSQEAATPATAQTRQATPAPAAQTRKGQLSITGAPNGGSNPAVSKTVSARSAVDAAFASLGIG